MARLRFLSLLPLMGLLTGCDFVVLAPSGDVALQQRDLLVVSTLLMLLIIVPVMALTVFFAWKYRASNKAADYQPNWDHSMSLELVVWAAPLLIIICLGAMTWLGTHLLDPYRPIDRIAAGKPVTEQHERLEVEVVALDWKWLFIYPQYGIATVNELAAPVDRPIDFRITSSSVMNAFYIPALAGQIYAMAGMETQLHAVINQPGKYAGFSSNYSGAGFSGMRFDFLGLSSQDFDGWVEKARSSAEKLDRQNYLKLEKPSEEVPVMRFAGVDDDLYGAILNMCVEPGKMCMNEMMSIDEAGGLGLAGVYNVVALEYDKHERRGAVFGPHLSHVAAICTKEEAEAAARENRFATDEALLPRDMTPLRGFGLPRPFPTRASPGSFSMNAEPQSPSKS